MLKKEFSKKIEIHSKSYVPPIVSKSKKDYIHLLRQVRFYKKVHENDIEIKSFYCSEIASFATHEKDGVKIYKIKQHEFFQSALGDLVVPEIFAFKYKNNQHDHIINLPIVEKVGNKYYIVDGHTRLFMIYENYKSERKNKLIEIVVINLQDHECRVTHTDLSDLNRLDDYKKRAPFNDPFARYVEKETHMLQTYDWKKEFPLKKEPN